MSLSLVQTVTAIAVNNSTSFAGSGGTPNYTYSVLAGGAGGTINASGIYTAPSSIGSTPLTNIDTIKLVDSASNSVTGQILVGTPVELFCDILQNQLNQMIGLGTQKIYLWDQKINIANDDNGLLYIAVSVPSVKSYANNISSDSYGNSIQSVTCQAVVEVDIHSRMAYAHHQKEYVLLALASQYSELQQEANGFYISPLTTDFINLSQIDGAAIPYRYKISFMMHYTVSNTMLTPFYSSFQQPNVVVG